jgi:hypothetical protein
MSVLHGWALASTGVGMHSARRLMLRVTVSPAVHGLKALRELFWLEKAARRLAPLSLERRLAISRQVESAVQMMRAAERTEGAQLRLELAERALRTLLPALAAAHGVAGGAGSPSLEEALAHAANLPGAHRHERALERARGGSDLETRQGPAIAELERAFAWLEARVDLHTERELRAARVLRCGALGLALVFVGGQALGARNLARGAPVTASSSCGSEPPPPLGKEAGFRLVDGWRRERTYAFCTQPERGAWVTVDLGRARRIDEVVVYSRNDCCWGRNSRPLSVQLSLDNQEFATIATREAPFTAQFPWHLAVDHERARYVRLFTPAERPTEIVLSELEVFGR